MAFIEFLLYGFIVSVILFGLKIVVDVASKKGDPKGNPTPPEFQQSRASAPAVPVMSGDRRRDDGQ